MKGEWEEAKGKGEGGRGKVEERGEKRRGKERVGKEKIVMREKGDGKILYVLSTQMNICHLLQSPQ